MPVNQQVDGTDGQVCPTAEDYFQYYPEMRHKVSSLKVTALIGGRAGAYQDWNRDLNEATPQDIERARIEQLEIAKVEPRVAQISNLVDQQFRLWCDANWQRLTPQLMLQAFCEILHTAVNALYLGQHVGGKK